MNKTAPKKATVAGTPRARMIADLKKSVLTIEDAQSLGFVPMSMLECADLGLSRSGDGYLLPYFNIRGEKIEMFRYRYFDTVVTSGFTKGAKLHKYDQPGGTPPACYFPKLPGVDWEEIRRDPSIPLILTEGEKKSACVTKHISPCIGLGGVFSFSRRQHGQRIIPDLAQFVWDGRDVYICYDSDAVTNKQVVTAEARLATLLTGLLAKVHIIRLPQKDEGAKVGVDDYIAAEGAEAFAELLNSTREETHLLEFHRLNSEVIYVRNPSMIFEHPKADHPEDQPRYRMMSVQKFATEVYATRKYLTVAIDGKMIEKPAAKDWVQWEGRAEVDSVVYEPGEDPIVNNNQLNVWQGWGADPVKGDVSLFLKLIDYMMTGAEPGHRHWLMQWLAYPIIHAGAKMNTAVVMWSLTQGVGKSLLGYTMGHIYGQNYAEVTNVVLQGSFNSWAVNKQFILGEEITAGATRESADVLKNMITGKQITVNEKYVPSYTLRNCTNYYFTSNHPDAFFVNSQDRRYFVHEITVKAPDEFFAKYDKWYRTPEAASAIMYYLKHEIDMTGFNPEAQAPKTKAHAEMVTAGDTELGVWCAELATDPDRVLSFQGIVNQRTLWTLKELHDLYLTESGKRKHVSEKALAIALKEKGFKRACNGDPILINGIRQRIWIIRPDPAFLRMTALKIADRYNEERQRPTSKQSIAGAKSKF